ncbi:hypothetical protein R1X32_11950 [Rhodococcus opacus]
MRDHHRDTGGPQASPRCGVPHGRAPAVHRPASHTPTGLVSEGHQPRRARRHHPGLVSRSVEAAIEWLKTHIHQLLETARDRGAMLTEKIKQKIQEWIETLVDEVAHGGVGMQAGLEGVRAAPDG